jgi:tetratricopeptide (TPR) repeat protein
MLRFLTGLAGVSCLIAAIIPVRLAYAEALFRNDSPQSVRRALWLDRGAPPAGYFERLATIDPSQAGDSLEAAASADPHESAGWIALGLERERQRRFPEAARDLLQAARVDHQYLPAWTLANFYFRRDDYSAFWMWARRAAALNYDDFRPLLALAQRLEPDAGRVDAGLVDAGPMNAGEILDRLSAAPSGRRHDAGLRRRLARAGLNYWGGLNRYDEAQQAARRLLPFASEEPEDRSRLIDAAGWQMRGGHGANAVELWMALFPALSPGHPDPRYIDPGRGIVLANADLQVSPGGEGFNWTLPASGGIEAQWQPRQLEFSFSGTQPESCVLLEQILPLAPEARQYRLSFEYSSQGLASPTGVRWSFGSLGAEVPQTQESPALPPSPEATRSWQAGQAVFAAPVLSRARGGRGETHASETDLARLRLIYRREPGTVRSQGRFEIRHLHMEVLFR